MSSGSINRVTDKPSSHTGHFSLLCNCIVATMLLHNIMCFCYMSTQRHRETKTRYCLRSWAGQRAAGSSGSALHNPPHIGCWLTVELSVSDMFLCWLCERVRVGLGVCAFIFRQVGPRVFCCLLCSEDGDSEVSIAVFVRQTPAYMSSITGLHIGKRAP